MNLSSEYRKTAPKINYDNSIITIIPATMLKQRKLNLQILQNSRWDLMHREGGRSWCRNNLQNLTKRHLYNLFGTQAS